MRSLLLGVCFIFLMTGCTPRTIVRQNPGPRDRGIRYYRPKPYLLVQPTPVKEDAEVRQDRYVQISLDYLPDFSEEYSINVRTGLGSNDTTITLEDGWKLTSINQKLDSKFDKNVSAIADLIKAAAPGGIVGTEGDDSSRGPSIIVKATNIPIGYYESVIARGPDCKKQLYGWRYVGFAPFSPCPLKPKGAECVDCRSSPLYGMVFRDGVMVFEVIHDIAQRGLSESILVPATLPRSLPLSHEVLGAMVPRAMDAFGTHLALQPNSFKVRIDDSDPHIVFTLITEDTDEAKELLEKHEIELGQTLEGIIQKSTYQSRSVAIRVMGEETMPEPINLGQ